MATTDLIILGASARAAAQSARRAGLRPWCVDLFADTDLAAFAPVRRIAPADYPHGFASIVQDNAPPAPILYTGGLEDYPAVLSGLAQDRPVWGYIHPDPQAGDSVRNPRFLQDLCASSGMARPALVFRPTGLPRDGSWLVKPRVGSGGVHITRWRGQSMPDPDACFFQQYIPGVSLSATYVTSAAGTSLLGVTRQWIGESFLHAPTEFAYCGNLALDLQALSPRLLDEMRRVGDGLPRADRRLRGLFGVDFIVAGETPYLIEVNPRYTASVEVLESLTCQPFLLRHALAFVPQANLPPLPPGPSAAKPPTSPVAKGIYYAARRFKFPDSLSQNVFAPDPWHLSDLADLPAAGGWIEQGQPVLTFLQQGPDAEGTIRHQSAAWNGLTGGPRTRS